MYMCILRATDSTSLSQSPRRVSCHQGVFSTCPQVTLHFPQYTHIYHWRSIANYVNLQLSYIWKCNLCMKRTEFVSERNLDFMLRS